MIIKNITAREILDSRGNPTIETKVELENGQFSIASVPSGASIGKYEAIELHDEDPTRFQGKGVLKAVNNVNQIIAPKLKGENAIYQQKIDQLLVQLDGTANKSRLGANAVLSVSQGVCEAAAVAQKIPLYQYIAKIYGSTDKLRIPVATYNIINGGKHGAGNLDFQEFHIIPAADKNFAKSLQIAVEVYQSLKRVLIRHGAVHSVGDEGGFAPNLFTNVEAFTVLVEAINLTAWRLGLDLALGLDVAAGTFYKDGRYLIRDKVSPLSSDELIDFYHELVGHYPLKLLEDPFTEDDWAGWINIQKKLTNTLIIGDDLLATNLERAREAIKKKACQAILVKPNQAGTITETIEVVKVCRQANWQIVVSHRSGETNDDFIADFAVGLKADYIKFGAPARGERVAKYNRLLDIEKELLQ